MFGWKRTPADPDQSGVRADPQVGTDDLAYLFDAIEGVARRLYAAHGLPDQPGQYQRGEGEETWSLVGESLSPAEKFDLILKAPDEGRVRYAALDRLGARHPNIDVRKASALLAACRGLKTRLDGHAPMDAQTLADAIRLGALYQALASSLPELGPQDIISQPATSSGS